MRRRYDRAREVGNLDPPGRSAGAFPVAVWTMASWCSTSLPRPHACQDYGGTTMREIGHFIGGKYVAGSSGKFGDVFNPASG